MPAVGPSGDYGTVTQHRKVATFATDATPGSSVNDGALDAAPASAARPGTAIQQFIAAMED